MQIDGLGRASAEVPTPRKPGTEADFRRALADAAPADGPVIRHNGRDVAYADLPQDVRDRFAAADADRAALAAYQERVKDDPAYGSTAKLRPYDPALDEAAMRRFAAMDPTTAHMSPEDYYNFMGSDAEVYQGLQAEAARTVPGATPIFVNNDPVRESKVAFIHEQQAAGTPLPESFAAFEEAWRAHVARQADLAGLLDLASA